MTDGVRCQELIGYGEKIPVLMAAAELARTGKARTGEGQTGEGHAREEQTEEEVKVVTLKCVSGHIHNYTIPIKS